MKAGSDSMKQDVDSQKTTGRNEIVYKSPDHMQVVNDDDDLLFSENSESTGRKKRIKKKYFKVLKTTRPSTMNNLGSNSHET
jgi:hypothetical protein